MRAKSPIPRYIREPVKSAQKVDERKIAIGSRLFEIIKAMDVTTEQFAIMVGSKKDNLYNYKAGKAEPNSIFYQKLVEIGVNREYVETGRGEMFIDPSEEEYLSRANEGIVLIDGDNDGDTFPFPKVFEGQKLAQTLKEIEPSNVRSISKFQGKGMRVYTIPANAGYGFSLEDMPTGFDTRPLYANPDDMLVVPVSGDSMEPEIKSGDTVFVDTSREAQNGEIVLCNVDGVNYVKWYMQDDDGNYLESENAENYEPMKINGFNNSRIYGVVVDIQRKPRRRRK